MLPPHVVPSPFTGHRVPASPYPQPQTQQQRMQRMLSLTWALAGVRGGSVLVSAAPVPAAASSKLSPEPQEPHIEGEEEPPH